MLSTSGRGGRTVSLASGTLRKDDRPIVIGAGYLEPTRGSASGVEVASRCAASALNNYSEEHLGRQIEIPSSWNTYDVDLWHTTAIGNGRGALVSCAALKQDYGDALDADDTVNVSVASPAATANTFDYFYLAGY